jgi:hypothetical protein
VICAATSVDSRHSQHTGDHPVSDNETTPHTAIRSLSLGPASRRPRSP